MALSIQEMKTVIKKIYHLQADQKLHVPVCFWGSSGVGKTAGVSQAAEDLTRELGQPVACVILKPGQADSAGDLLGMPEIVTYYDCPRCFRADKPCPEFEVAELLRHTQKEHGLSAEETHQEVKDLGLVVGRRQRFAMPDIWPRKGPVIVCVDEINRASPDVRNSLFGLVNERVFELTGYRLPDDAVIVATANPPTGAYTDVHELDGAMIKRMVHFSVEPDADEWLAHMAQQPEAQTDIGRKALGFFVENRNLLHVTEEPNPILEELQHCNRTGQALIRLANVLDGKLLAEAAAGTLGVKAAESFVTYMRKHEEFVRAKDIFTDYAKVQGAVEAMAKAGRQDIFLHTQEDMVRFLGKHERALTAKQLRHFAEFLDDLQADQVWSLLHLLMKLGTEAAPDAPIQKHLAAINEDRPIKAIVEAHSKRVQTVLATTP